MKFRKLTAEQLDEEEQLMPAWHRLREFKEALTVTNEGTVIDDSGVEHTLHSKSDGWLKLPEDCEYRGN